MTRHLVKVCVCACVRVCAWMHVYVCMCMCGSGSAGVVKMLVVLCLTCLCPVTRIITWSAWPGVTTSIYVRAVLHTHGTCSASVAGFGAVHVVICFQSAPTALVSAMLGGYRSGPLHSPGSPPLAGGVCCLHFSCADHSLSTSGDHLYTSGRYVILLPPPLPPLLLHPLPLLHALPNPIPPLPPPL